MTAQAVTVTITRARHPLQGQSLPVLGRMQRHGRLALLLELGDGSKRLIPQEWTDRADAWAGDGAAMLGSPADLLAAAALPGALAERVAGWGQTACTSPSKEDPHAACPTQFDTRPGSGAGAHTRRDAAGGGGRGRDHAAGRPDRQGNDPAHRDGGERR